MSIKSIDEMTLEEQLALISKYDALTDRVKQYIFDSYKDHYSFYLHESLFRFTVGLASVAIEIESCESPIEQLLYLAMFNRFLTGGFYAEFEPQRYMNVCGNKYRVDFLITIVDDFNGWVSSGHSKEFKRFLVVECDGHDFHEKTKQQSQKDKQRDRNFQISGYPVMRFTGSEIYKNPDKCCEEIVSYITASKG